MSKSKLQPMPNPLLNGKGEVEQSVQYVIDNSHLAPPASMIKITIRIPVDLRDTIRGEAARITGRERGGFQDMLIELVRYGLDAYLEGKITLEKYAKTKETGLRRSG